MKQYAKDVTHKYVYGILFILLATTLFPATFVSVMAYFFFVSQCVALAGYVLRSPKTVMVANTFGALFTIIIGGGILINSWKWRWED